MSEIDTGPLSKMVDNQRVRPARLLMTFLVVVLPLTLTGILFAVFDLLDVWLFLCFVVVGGLAFIFYFYSEIIRKRAIKNFALLNGLEPLEDIVAIHHLPPSIQSTGIRQTIKNAYTMKLNNRLDYLFDCSCNEGRNKYFYSVAVFQSSKIYPHIFLDGRKNGQNQTYKSWQKLELEGDFNKYFDLYSENNAHIETLSLLAPDVMQSLVDSAQMYDVEIYDNNVALITWDTSIYTKTNMDRLLNCLNAMMKEVSALKPGLLPQSNHTVSKLKGLSKRSKVMPSIFAVIIIVLFIVLQIAANLLDQ